MVSLIQLSLLYIACQLIVLEGIKIDDFYPFGVENHDKHLDKTDDESNDMILDVELKGAFKFYGKDYTSISVSLRVDSNYYMNMLTGPPFVTYLLSIRY